MVPIALVPMSPMVISSVGGPPEVSPVTSLSVVIPTSSSVVLASSMVLTSSVILATSVVLTSSMVIAPIIMTTSILILVSVSILPVPPIIIEPPHSIIIAFFFLLLLPLVLVYVLLVVTPLLSKGHRVCERQRSHHVLVIVDDSHIRIPYPLVILCWDVYPAPQLPRTEVKVLLEPIFRLNFCLVGRLLFLDGNDLLGRSGASGPGFFALGPFDLSDLFVLLPLLFEL
mmetsp:Transcript_44951/g.43526  ORF Transcript_44951/g.43526 Transcript_44951/m.43526 type:complete len:228 (-) Transcript_44951:712-1395(-)